MIDDTLYGEIKKEGEIRTETEVLTEHLSVEYEITTKNGQDHYLIKSIIITSHGLMTVKIDDKTVVQPPQPYQDDGCYFHHKPMISYAIPNEFFLRDPEAVLASRQRSKPPTRKRRTPCVVGSVGLPKLREDIPQDSVRHTCLDALRNMEAKR